MTVTITKGRYENQTAELLKHGRFFVRVQVLDTSNRRLARPLIPWTDVEFK